MDEKKEVKIPTLTLNPNETEVAAAQAVQEQVNAVAEEVKEEVPAEKLGLDSLTPEEQAAVMEFVDKIDVLNTEQILNYGSNAQKNIADFSESALETVKTKDLGQVGEMLGNLVVELKGLNFDEEEKKGLLGLFKKTKKDINSLKAQYDKAEVNVDKIVEQLEQHEVVLMKDVSLMDRMSA